MQTRTSWNEKAFAVRRQLYRKYFATQMSANLTKSVYTDALFNGIYLLLTAENPFEEIPSMSESINLAMPFIRRQLTNVYEAKTTKDVSRICLELVDVFDDIIEKDMLNTYFFLAELQYDQLEEGLTFEDLKRKDSLVNDDILEHEKDGDEDIHEEKMEMWHRETSEATQSFLQFDMDQGSKQIC